MAVSYCRACSDHDPWQQLKTKKARATSAAITHSQYGCNANTAVSRSESAACRSAACRRPCHVPDPPRALLLGLTIGCKLWPRAWSNRSPNPLRVRRQLTANNKARGGLGTCSGRVFCFIAYHNNMMYRSNTAVSVRYVFDLGKRNDWAALGLLVDLQRRNPTARICRLR